MPTFTPADYSAICLSLKVAVTATLLSLPFGFAAAWLMTFRQFRGKVLLDVLINLPLTLPPVVIGYLLLLLLGQKGWLGQHLLQPLGIRIIFTWKAAVIATAVVGFPLMFARGLGEFGATIIVAGNIPGVTQTIPLAIYDYTGSPHGDVMALALCLVSICISVAILLFHEYLCRRLVRAD